MAIETDKTDAPTPDDAEKILARRRKELLYRFVDEINASSKGITPKWERAIETHRRVKAERVKGAQNAE